MHILQYQSPCHSLQIFTSTDLMEPFNEYHMSVRWLKLATLLALLYNVHQFQQCDHKSITIFKKLSDLGGSLFVSLKIFILHKINSHIHLHKLCYAFLNFVCTTWKVTCLQYVIFVISHQVCSVCHLIFSKEETASLICKQACLCQWIFLQALKMQTNQQQYS